MKYNLEVAMWIWRQKILRWTISRGEKFKGMWSCRRHRSIEISIEKLPIGLSIIKVSMRFAMHSHTRTPTKKLPGKWERKYPMFWNLWVNTYKKLILELH